MAVRSSSEGSLDESFSEEKEAETVEEWEKEEGNGSDVQDRLDRHSLVSHGQQIAIVQEQMLMVIDELGTLRKLCLSVRVSSEKTNSMLEVLGKHLGVQLGTGIGTGRDSDR